MNDSRSARFAKLMSTMGAPKELANPGIDDNTDARMEMERQLSMIDSKIAELEESNDPNSLESLKFWKQRRDMLAAD